MKAVPHVPTDAAECIDLADLYAKTSIGETLDQLNPANLPAPLARAPGHR